MLESYSFGDIDTFSLTTFAPDLIRIYPTDNE